jgi:cupredoxin-like protein
MKLPKVSLGKLHITLTGLVLATIAVGALAAFTIGFSSSATATASAASPGVQDELQIQLSNDGFSPSEVQRAAGTFAIAVENANVEGEYTLRLKAADGTVVKEVQIQKGSAAWTVTLTAGEYTLTEASHPQWQCRITVQ